MKILDVVNECLGTMGETPLNSLEDPHSFRGAAIAKLEKVNAQVQARGWWFNRETITLAPSALNSHIYLPGDAVSARIPRNQYGQPLRNVVLRGRRLYDRDGGTYTFAESVTVDVIRKVPFEELPETAAQHIAALAVQQFQAEYDGDTAKGRDIKDRIENPRTGTYAAINADETREQKVNLIESNGRLMRLKAITKSARRLLR